MASYGTGNAGVSWKTDHGHPQPGRNPVGGGAGTLRATHVVCNDFGYGSDEASGLAIRRRSRGATEGARLAGSSSRHARSRSNRARRRLKPIRLRAARPFSLAWWLRGATRIAPTHLPYEHSLEQP